MKKIFINRRNVFITLLSFIFGCMITISFQPLQCEKNDKKNLSNLINENTNTFLIVLILSSPRNFNRRNAIRNTWINLNSKFINYDKSIIYIPEYNSEGFLIHESIEKQQEIIENYKNWMNGGRNKLDTKISNIKIKYFFSIGLSGLSQDEISDLIAENNNNGDLLFIPSLQDSYYNLTNKLLQSLTNLNKIYKYKYLLKCDDDSYVKLDLLLHDLKEYDNILMKNSNDIWLYWGYFNGKANIKSSGQWKETNYHLSDTYIPYALGGGYVISYEIVKYLITYKEHLNKFVSEDISMGTWLVPFKNIHRRHDIRFDTAYLPRKCKNYHLILHKKADTDIYDIYDGKLCSSKYDKNIKNRPVEYFYDWTQSPTKCCFTYT